jgi:predicted permease
MTFARAPGRALFRWAAPAAVGLALVLLGAALASLFDVSRPGTWRIGLVAMAHQAIAYALCWCRAFWLSATLGLVKAES